MSSSNLALKLDDTDDTQEDFLSSVVAGLSGRTKTLSCKFFYDATGSELFDQICRVPEYYPTRTECQILKCRAAELAARIGREAGLVEFGAGAGVKVRLLLEALERPYAYVPVDISREFLLSSAARLAMRFPALRVLPICADYTRAMERPAILDSVAGRIVGFFPGATIGNFTRPEAVAFLSSARRLLGPGSLMIVGADLVKDAQTLVAAYDDSAGVTAAFNLNLLHRINRELQGDLAIHEFSHSARWNAVEGRIEMHLVSRRRQEARVGGYRFRFAEGESIHTENSYKYTVEGFQTIAEASGYVPRAHWVDDRELFSVHLLEAAG